MKLKKLLDVTSLLMHVVITRDEDGETCYEGLVKDVPGRLRKCRVTGVEPEYDECCDRERYVDGRYLWVEVDI